MIQIYRINIESIDIFDDEEWMVNGEVVFKGEIISNFKALYYVDNGDIKVVKIDDIPYKYSTKILEKMIISEIYEYSENEL